MISIVNKINEANCITHSGTIHADEVFATAFLELYLGEAKVFRTNNINLESIPKETLVYDIGRGKYDHHQNNTLRRANEIPYCAFGLLFKEYGEDFLKKRGIENYKEVFEGIDKDLVEGIDADDNGVFPKIEADYKVKTISGIIKLFNPSYLSNQKESDQFVKAVTLARMIFEEEIVHINGKVLARQKMLKVIENISPTDKYLILDEYLPYEEVLLNCENASNILYVAFPSNRGGYAIKTVPISSENRNSRLPFPSEWASKEGNILEDISKIKGLRFCHTERFIVNCESLETVHAVLSQLCEQENR